MGDVSLITGRHFSLYCLLAACLRDHCQLVTDTFLRLSVGDVR